LGILDSLQPPLKILTPHWTDAQPQDFTEKVKADIINDKICL
jgi:hypothetical protein